MKECSSSPLLIIDIYLEELLGPAGNLKPRLVF